MAIFGDGWTLLVETIAVLSGICGVILQSDDFLVSSLYKSPICRSSSFRYIA